MRPNINFSPHDGFLNLAKSFMKPKGDTIRANQM